MEKNIRKNPFGLQQTTETPTSSKPNIKSTINNPINRTQETREEPITQPPKISSNQNIQKIPGSFYSTDKSEEDISKKEYESLKVFNSSKNFLTVTTECLPSTNSLLKESSLPIGLIINPLSHFESDLPLIDYGEKNEIPRCISSQCRAYINPFVKFTEDGFKWICNLCKHVNNTDEYYQCRLDKHGIRTDINNKPDLNSGSYEFLANKTYMNKERNISNPCFVFVIDVSQASIQNGFLTAVLETIKDVINNDSIPVWERTKIGIITYDSSVHFYCLSDKYTQPQMLCVPDDSLFLPAPVNHLLVNLAESKKTTLTAIDLIQTSFTTNTCKDSNKMLNAVNAAYLLAKGVGGKVVIFNSSTSLINLPKIKSPNSNNIPKDEVLYTATDDKQLSTLGINLTNEKISCDLYLSSDSYTICDYTNGNLYFYKNFRLETHYKNIFNQLRRTLTKTIFYDSVIRTRFSRGYKISQFITPVLISNNDLLICSTLDSDQTYTFGLDMIESDPTTNGGMSNLNNSDSFVYFQTAILFTHPDGTRRIRIHNLCLPTSNRLTDIYENADMEVISAYFMKSALDKIYKTKKMANSVLAVESYYKSLIASVLSSQQSLKKDLPDCFSYLPLFMLGVFRHRVFCKDEAERKMDIDLNTYLRIKLQKLSKYDVMPFICPRIYNINELLLDESIGSQDERTD